MTEPTPLAEVVARLKQEKGIAMTLIERLEAANRTPRPGCVLVLEADVAQILSALRIATEHAKALRIPVPAWNDPELADKAEDRLAKLRVTRAAFVATFAPASAGKEEQEK